MISFTGFSSVFIVLFTISVSCGLSPVIFVRRPPMFMNFISAYFTATKVFSVYSSILFGKRVTVYAMSCIFKFIGDAVTSMNIFTACNYFYMSRISAFTISAQMVSDKRFRDGCDKRFVNMSMYSNGMSLEAPTTISGYRAFLVFPAMGFWIFCDMVKDFQRVCIQHINSLYVQPLDVNEKRMFLCQ